MAKIIIMIIIWDIRSFLEMLPTKNFFFSTLYFDVSNNNNGFSLLRVGHISFDAQHYKEGFTHVGYMGSNIYPQYHNKINLSIFHFPTLTFLICWSHRKLHIVHVKFSVLITPRTH